jgi:hypothetical protein
MHALDKVMEAQENDDDVAWHRKRCAQKKPLLNPLSCDGESMYQRLARCAYPSQAKRVLPSGAGVGDKAELKGATWYSYWSTS